MTRIFILFAFCFVMFTESLFAESKLDSLLSQLDRTIEQEFQYSSIKETRIEDLKLRLDETFNPKEKFSLYKKIFEEYEAYLCDSAYFYSQIIDSLAEQTNDVYWINENKIQKSKILTISGMYPEAIELLVSINKTSLINDQVYQYFAGYYHAYDEWNNYTEYEYSAKYKELGGRYRDSLLLVLQPNSFEYAYENSWKYIETEEYDKARKLLFSFLPKVEINTRQYSMITSIIGILYWYLEDIEKHKEYLAISAISDIRAAVKENTSLKSLAILLYSDGYLERANTYIEKSMNDANFYNARLRSLQISKIYPLIENAYHVEREKQQNKMRTLLIVISILSLLLIFTILLIIRQLNKLEYAKKQIMIANDKLKNNNNELAEANHIKEEYIGHFSNLCSIYIKKMEKQHLILNKKARQGNLNEFFKQLKSKQFIEDELNDFYHNFDSTFLQIFPDFVNQFNALLVEEEKIVPKTGEKLTIELRVFALMRLGITDSKKIADFLRYSITTIYNFRSKYRNKSIVPRDEFENHVMKISSF